MFTDRAALDDRITQKSKDESLKIIGDAKLVKGHDQPPMRQR